MLTERASSVDGRSGTIPRLLVIQCMRLGDTLQTTPAVQELRQLYPAARLEMLTLREHAPALEGLPVDSFHWLEERERAAMTAELEAAAAGQAAPISEAVARRLELGAFSHIFNFDFGLPSAWLCGELLKSGAGAVRHTGGYWTGGQQRFHDLWPCYFISAAEAAHAAANRINAVDLYRCAARQWLRAEQRSEPLAPVSVYLAAAGAADVNDLRGDVRWVAVNPGAQNPQRRWPREAFAQLIARLRARGLAIVLVGAPQDAELCASLAAEAVSGSPPLLNLAGKTSLPRMRTILESVCLLISNDTGAVHLAAATGTPLLGLYARTQTLALSAPWRPGGVLLGPAADGRELSVELVAAAAEALLFGSGADLFALAAGTPHVLWRTRMAEEGAAAPGGIICERFGGAAEASGARADADEEAFLLALRDVLMCAMAGETRTEEAMAKPAANGAWPKQEPVLQALAELAGLAEVAARAARRQNIAQLQKAAQRFTSGVDELLRQRAPLATPALRLLLRTLDIRIGHVVEPTVADSFAEFGGMLLETRCWVMAAARRAAEAGGAAAI